MVKNILFYAILLYTSVRDHKTHTVPDSVHVLILLAALSGIRWFSSLLGFLLVPLPFLAAALRKPESMGGGDIKLMAACGFPGIGKRVSGGSHRAGTGCIGSGGILEKSECPLCIDTIFSSRMFSGKFYKVMED